MTPPESAPAPLAGAKASTSSKNTTQGAARLARSNTSLTRNGTWQACGGRACLPLTLANVHIDELRAFDTQEIDRALIGHRLGQQSLSGAGRAVQQNSGPLPQPTAAEESFVFQRELDGVHDGALAVLKAAHIVPLGARGNAGSTNVRGGPLAQDGEGLVDVLLCKLHIPGALPVAGAAADGFGCHDSPCIGAQGHDILRQEPHSLLCKARYHRCSNVDVACVLQQVPEKVLPVLRSRWLNGNL
mmetsp:Transcript_11157/g.31607  ORF Transcript_11157/g.31607 Transcript_11157/m.31607 type:complete len:244 (+) Transcript_11157:1247-1978(+)